VALTNTLCEKTRSITRDVVLTKEVWERTRKISHFKAASNSFVSKTWKR